MSLNFDSAHSHAHRDATSDDDCSRSALLTRDDPFAANALLLRVLPRVHRRVRNLVRTEDVSDLCQEALLRILECLPSYRGEGRFEAWVDSVTTRVTLRAVGKRRSDRRRLEDAHVTPAIGNAGVSSPHRVLSGTRAVDALQRVPGKQRTAIVMHYVLGMTVAEMSDELCVPIETIRSRLRVGMGQVRAHMGVF
jgi:RNA polymerase sigma-70 factor, ECF subfamily